MTEDAASNYVRSPELLSAASSRLLIVDMQAKLLPFIPVAGRLIHNCRRLIESAGVLDVAVSATEQYPKGLGHTTFDLRELLGNIPDKQRFSCAEVLDWGGAGTDDDDRFQVVVAGIEAHVCVLQTVLDLIAEGYRVYVPADAVGSRQKLDWKIALDRMSASGATITTTESVMFEWCEVSGTPAFKEISRLVKDSPPDTPAERSQT